MNLALLRKALARPGDARHYALGILRGRFYKWYLPLRGRRFSAGEKFRVYGRLTVRGPGRVEFGDDVSVWGWVTPYTHDPNAVITVGDHTKLSGTRFGCATGITIGRDGIIAECQIMDTDFHTIAVNRRDERAHIRTLPVKIGDNVWIAPSVALMPGTVIGDNCVVGFGAVASGTFPPNVIVVGNPARIGGKVPAATSSDQPADSHTGEGDGRLVATPGTADLVADRPRDAQAATPSPRPGDGAAPPAGPA
jgi:acetyltransferase-like isoleucine patch superfamily enzyme